MSLSQSTRMNHTEDYCYDGDADDDSFQSAICEKYNGFHFLHPLPTEPLPTENSNDILHTRTGSFEVLYTSGDGNVVLYALDENEIIYNDGTSLSSAHSRTPHLLNDNEDDLSYLSYESSLYDTDISLDDDIEQEFLILTLSEERNIILKKLNTPSDELQLSTYSPSCPQISSEESNSVKYSMKFNANDNEVICNIQDLESVRDIDIPHLDSTNISETDQSLLSLYTHSQSYR